MLKGKGLTNQSINKAMDALKGLTESMGMKGMEPLVFVPVFDRELSENATGVVDLADYFNCPVLDVMMYYCYLADLEDCGLSYFGLESGNGFGKTVPPVEQQSDGGIDAGQREGAAEAGQRTFIMVTVVCHST